MNQVTNARLLLPDKSVGKCALKLKGLLVELGIEQSQLAAALSLSAAAVAQLLNHNMWPKRLAAAQLKRRIGDFLRKSGASNKQITCAFETAAVSGATASRSPNNSPNNLMEELMLLRKQTLHPATRRHFNLIRDPFAEVSDINEVYQNETIRYTRAAMLDCAKRGGFMAVIGESGSGKSTLRRDLIARIEREGLPVRVIQPYVLAMEDNDSKGKTLKAVHIAEAILSELAPHAKMRASSEARFRQLDKELRASHQSGNRHVLIIEEAHSLPIPTLKHLKRFTELEHGFTKLLSIILIGQPELADKLSEQNAAVREVVQRCEVMTLPPLGTHLADYLDFRFKLTDSNIKKVLNDEAVQAIHDRLQPAVPRGHKGYSLLYPLAVHNLLTAAMNLAADAGAQQVSADIVLEV